MTRSDLSHVKKVAEESVFLVNMFSATDGGQTFLIFLAPDNGQIVLLISYRRVVLIILLKDICFA